MGQQHERIGQWWQEEVVPRARRARTDNGPPGPVPLYVGAIDYAERRGAEPPDWAIQARDVALAAEAVALQLQAESVVAAMAPHVGALAEIPHPQ